jgi:hypothetical protein
MEIKLNRKPGSIPKTSAKFGFVLNSVVSEKKIEVGFTATCAISVYHH